MTRIAIIGTVVAVVLGSGCGGNAPRKVTMAPRTCAEPKYGSLTAAGTVRAERGIKVGVAFSRGNGHYRVQSARVEVLAPNAILHNASGPDPIHSRANTPVLSREEGGFDAADREFAVTFTGSDSSGNPLPPGLYPVVMELRTEPAGRCEGGGALVSGVLSTLDWRG